MKRPGFPGRDGGEVPIRAGLLGGHSTLSLRALGAALGVFAAVLLGALLTDPTTSWAEPQRYVFLLGWMASIAGAGYVAYQNSGILVSWLLVLAPTGAQLAYATWWQRGRAAIPAPAGPGLYGTFGTGAWLFWIPFSLLLGTLCFGFGVAVRWSKADAGC